MSELKKHEIVAEPLNLLEVLRAVGKRPMVYFGLTTRKRCIVWHLESFVVGWQTGRAGTGVYLEGDDILDVFFFWLCLRFDFPDGYGTMSWADILSQQCKGDDEAAFRMFFEVLEKYIQERAEIGPAALEANFRELSKNARRKKTKGG
jgi:hypothetical protein